MDMINSDVTIGLRELSNQERLETNGGLHPVTWALIGYVIGEVLDGIQDGIDRRAANECCK